jgi:hypothetical protein
MLTMEYNKQEDSMSDAKSFDCPNCGSPLTPDGDAKQVKCAFCGSTVFVPDELLDPFPQARQEWDSGQDPFSPQHLQWLVQNGADATAKVDSIKDKGETVVIYWTGTRATGGQFKNHAELTLPRPVLPRRGDTIQIKYNPADKDEIDFAFQIDGQFVRDTTLWDW